MILKYAVYIAFILAYPGGGGAGGLDPRFEILKRLAVMQLYRNQDHVFKVMSDQKNM